MPVRRTHALHGHLIACQGAGLVGADDRSGTQSLDRARLLDNGMVPGHALHAQGQGQDQDQDQDHGKDGGEPFRYGCRGQGDGREEGIDQVLEVCP